MYRANLDHDRGGRAGRRGTRAGRTTAIVAVLAGGLAAARPGAAGAQTIVSAAPATYVRFNNAANSYNVVPPANNPPDQPSFTYSRVTTSDAQQLDSAVLVPNPAVPGQTMPVAVAPAGVANNSLGGLLGAWPGAHEDVLMQQCFGGGFAWNMQGSVAVTAHKGYTFTSAAAWNEFAWNNGTPSANSNAAALTGLRNFTSSWLASFARPEGNYLHYLDATKGAPAATIGGVTYPAVPQDPYTNGGDRYSAANRRFESPTYASADPLKAGAVDLRGPNNSHQIIGNANQFAVLAAFSPNQDRFAANIERVYNQLIAEGVPAKNIAIVYGGMARGQLPAFPGLGLTGALNDGPNTLANFQNLVAGNAATWLGFSGNVPNANSNLFVYTTGHGTGFRPNGTALAAANPGTPLAPGAADAQFAMQYSPDAYDNPMTTLQISTKAPISAAQLAADQVTIDGYAVGTLSPSTPPATDDVSEYVGSTYTYTLQFASVDDISSVNGSPVLIDIAGLTSGLNSLTNNAVVAVTLDDGDGTYITTVASVPEPPALVLFATGLLGLFGLARHRLGRGPTGRRGLAAIVSGPLAADAPGLPVG
jgi:hypothetical protein